MRIPRPKEVRGILAEGCRQLLEKPVYSAVISLFGAGVRVAALKNRKARLLAKGQKDVWRRLDDALDPSGRYVWIHAASLGEFEQGRPIIEKIRREKPEYKILLTFFSPSGYEVRKDFAGVDCVCYLPFDTPGRVRRFMDKVNPEVAVFVKYEFWRNYLHELWRRQVPTYLVSAVFRPDQMFFKRRGAWYALWLRWYTRIFVQDERSRKLLGTIGVTDVDVCGDTRFDRVSDIRANRKPVPLLDSFTKRNSPGRPAVMMAGSSWQEDEAVYAGWFNSHPDVKLVIAPHEFDAARLAALRKLFVNGAVLMSEAEDRPDLAEGKQVLVIDCFGLLSSAYAYCDVAYVGGGFGAGLHNINEAAVYDVPVVYGPNNAKFIEAAEMARSGGGLPIASAEDFVRTADKLFGDPALRERLGKQAGDYIRSKIGATDRIFNIIFK